MSFELFVLLQEEEEERLAAEEAKNDLLEVQTDSAHKHSIDGDDPAVELTQGSSTEEQPAQQLPAVDEQTEVSSAAEETTPSQSAADPVE